MGEKKQRELWTIDDLEAYLKMSRSTIYMHIALGNIPFTQLGRAKRFIPDEVERAVKRGFKK